MSKKWFITAVLIGSTVGWFGRGLYDGQIFSHTQHAAQHQPNVNQWRLVACVEPYTDAVKADKTVVAYSTMHLTAYRRVFIPIKPVAANCRIVE